MDLLSEGLQITQAPTMVFQCSKNDSTSFALRQSQFYVQKLMHNFPLTKHYHKIKVKLEIRSGQVVRDGAGQNLRFGRQHLKAE